LKYQVKLPVAKIRREFEDCGDYWQWDLDVVSVDGGVLLLVQFPRWLLHADSNGRMVNSFYRGRRWLSMVVSSSKVLFGIPSFQLYKVML
jgi:hypothetical protein